MSNEVAKTAEFGPIRSFFWPIHKDELKKFIPMGMLMFFILFNYTVLRNTKDALVITSAGVGALPTLKLFCVLPMSILFVIIYTKLVNILSRETTFYTVVCFFISYFLLFAFVLFPNQELIHPAHETVVHLQEAYPRFQGLFSVWGVWSFSLFYVLSEIWGSAMISLLFWQFANEITRTEEAKRFYSMFGLIANFSLIGAGASVKWLSVKSGGDPGQSISMLVALVTTAGVAIMYIYNWINKNVLTNPLYYDAAAKPEKAKKTKLKLSMWESVKYIFTSKYIGFIALLVIGYGMSINLIEMVWKNELRALYPAMVDYNAFMGLFSTTTGIATILLILLTKGIVKKFGWFWGAIVTPSVMLVTSIIFFGFVFFSEAASPIAAMFGVSSLFLAVIVGAAQNIFSKSSKYSLFDPTKEMAYIPLDQELKVKGKAAVDVIGSRLGKAGGGAVAFTLFTLMSTADVMVIAPYMAGLAFLVIFLWIIAVGGLNVEYKKKLEAAEKAEKL